MPEQESGSQRPLRILAFLHSFEPGGVERVALRLCHAWQTDGADVTVLLGRTDGAMRAQAPPIHYVRYASGPFSTARFETAWMILCLWRQVRAAPPDVIFCAGNSYSVAAVVLRLLLRGRCPPVVAKVSNSLDRRDMFPLVRFAYRLWLRLQGPLIARWVGMVEPMRAEIAAAMRVREDDVAVIEDPALSRREARRYSEARDSVRRSKDAGRLFLSAGRLAAQKRFDLLIRAFARGSGAGDRLVILGEGPRRRRLEALVNRLGLAPRVRMPGHSRDLETWFARADALVLCSDYEGVPAVIIEAMAAGVPIIATDCSVGMAELVGHGRHGRLVGRGDERALAQAIAGADTGCPDLEGARRQANRFTVEQAAPAYLEVLVSAAAAQGARIAPHGKGRAASPADIREGPRLIDMNGGDGSTGVSD